MADKKISALTAATTPLAGTEVLPIVQSASTVKVAVNDMLGVTSWTSPAVNSEGNMFLRATDTLGTGVGTQIGLGGKYNASSYFPFAAVAGRKENATNNNVAGYLAFLTTTSGGTLTERARFNSTGNLAFSTAGNGIDFSANGGDVLTQYDEGTWTPNQGSGLVVVGAFSSSGTYTRIGRYIFASGTVTGATSISVSAIGQICDNLPFVKAGASIATGAAFASTLASKSITVAGGNIVYSLDVVTGGTSISFTMTYETN
jgi:hypothetical protein